MDGLTPPTAKSDLHDVFADMKRAARLEKAGDIRARRDALQRLVTCLRLRKNDIVRAVSDDFDGRVDLETMSSEVALSVQVLQNLIKNLPQWTKPKSVGGPFKTIPGRTYIRREPKGVVGILSPWNYPFQLAFIPAVTAFAAGNRVLVKPSEFSPRTNHVLSSIFEAADLESWIQVIEGDASVAEAFSGLPFDHLFFTGSTAIGRRVAQAAAANLTPVTLELGGKSPCLMMPDADISGHSAMVAFGKFYSGGQSCVAPDYLLVPAGKAEQYADAILKHASNFYGNPVKTKTFTSIATTKHREHLSRLISDANDRGAPSKSLDTEDTKQFPPTIVLNPPLDSQIMTEEVFGPLLPIVEYNTVDEAIALINDRDHPLALYVFGKDDDQTRRVLDRTLSGGAAINTTMLHLAVPDLPFGGVGASGQGAYRGERGFLEFSHERSVLEFPNSGFLRRLLLPPYGSLYRWLIGKTIGK